MNCYNGVMWFLFNHNDDYNKQIAVREKDIVYILEPVT